MKKILNIYKPLGGGLLETINLFRKNNPQYQDVKLGYAGRLDPMAEGVLLILVGDELKNQEKYWALDKEYEAEILLGFNTDTYDILGIPSTSQTPSYKHQVTNKFKTSNSKLIKILKKFEGEFTFLYPPYSSRTVKGKPLFWWARRDRLDEIEIPKKTSTIHNIEILDFYEMEKDILEKLIINRINLVKGNFRQKIIKNAWRKIFKNTKQQKFSIIKIRVFVSSGTYIRSIANELGHRLGMGAILLHLKRTKVGKFNINKSIKL